MDTLRTNRGGTLISHPCRTIKIFITTLVLKEDVMGSQCEVKLKVKKPYSADIEVSRLQIEQGNEKILKEYSLTIGSEKEGTIKIHFQLFNLGVFNITTSVFRIDDDGNSIPEDGKMYTVSSVADFIFFVLTLNASGYFDIVYSRPDAFELIRKIPNV